MNLEYTYFCHLKYHMNFFLHRTQSNVDVDDDIENEDSLILIDGANQLREEREQTGQSCPSTQKGQVKSAGKISINFRKVTRKMLTRY